MSGIPCDWQTRCSKLQQRGEQLLQWEQWADCSFLVGAEPHQALLRGHKLILAMASPVFEAMFYGGMAERNDPIPILDVQPEAFKSLLEYIYTDNININSFDKACELCYGAKKYMLPHLVQECTKYLWSDLYPKNACRAYEFAKLFEEPFLMEKCLQIIRTQTMEVLSEPSFEEVDLGTVITVFEQNHLNIDSELELFDAAMRYGSAQANNQMQSAGTGLQTACSTQPSFPAGPSCSTQPRCSTQPNSPEQAAASQQMSCAAPASCPSTQPTCPAQDICSTQSTCSPQAACPSQAIPSSPQSQPILASASPSQPETSNSASQDQQLKPTTSHPQITVAGPSKLLANSQVAGDGQSSAPHLSIRNAIQKIRFLTLSPQQFAEGLSRSSLLSESEAFAILMNISSPCCGVPMPEGFSTSTEPRRKSLFRPVQSFMVDSPSPVLGEPSRNSPEVIQLTATLRFPPPASAAPPIAAQPLPLLMPSHPANEPRDFSKYYCQRSIVHQTDCLNTSVLDCSVTFTVDKNICVIGIQVPTQVLGEDPQAMPASGTYSELLYAHLLDADGSRLTYTHHTARVPYRSLLEITFNRPFYIQRNKVYKVGVVFNKFGWYPMGVCCQRLACDSVFFNFGVGQSSDSVRDGLIRSIIFTY